MDHFEIHIQKSPSPRLWMLVQISGQYTLTLERHAWTVTGFPTISEQAVLTSQFINSLLKWTARASNFLITVCHFITQFTVCHFITMNNCSKSMENQRILILLSVISLIICLAINMPPAVIRTSVSAFWGRKGLSDKMCSLRCQEQHIENLTPTSCAKCTVPPKCSNNQFFANISRSMRSRGNSVGIENVSREISYRTDHSWVRLGLPISL